MPTSEVHVGQAEKFVLSQRAEGEGRVKSPVLEGLAVEAKEIFAPLE